MRVDTSKSKDRGDIKILIQDDEDKTIGEFSLFKNGDDTYTLCLEGASPTLEFDQFVLSDK